MWDEYIIMHRTIISEVMYILNVYKYYGAYICSYAINVYIHVYQYYGVCDEYIIMHRTIISEAHMDKSIATCVCTHNTKILKRNIHAIPKASQAVLQLVYNTKSFFICVTVHCFIRLYYSTVQCSSYSFIHSMGTLLHSDLGLGRLFALLCMHLIILLQISSSSQ